jgi:hypothetical protein
MITKDELEKILWSIALPGFAQILNKKFFKGLLLIGLEKRIRFFKMDKILKKKKM